MVQAASCHVPGCNVKFMTVSKVDQQPISERKQLIHFLLLF